MQNLSISLITAPREPYTLNASIRSLRNIGYEKTVNVFAEPSEAGYLIKEKNVSFHIHDEKKGAFKNHDYAIRWNMANSNDQNMLICSDDTIFLDDLLIGLEYAFHNYDDAVFCAFTLKTMPEIGNMIKGYGWNDISDIGWKLWGGNFAMSKDTAERIINHPFYMNHYDNYKENQQIDSCIAETCKLLGIKLYVRNPSLTYTIGYRSTLNHRSGTTDGYGIW